MRHLRISLGAAVLLVMSLVLAGLMGRPVPASASSRAQAARGIDVSSSNDRSL
jgi:hypothetical protein